ncbi:MAG: acyl-CoA dehydrogenase family protein [Deltaproteobacteria bacterium]|nr:acyl-CoA dehydrogenase family protein [Deltaproteobacteria bacterium]
MDLELSQEQRAIRDTFGRFAREVLAPDAAAIDEAGEFPEKQFAAVGALGFFGMRYPAAYGGTEADRVSMCLAAEQIARGSLSVGAAATMQALMGTHFVFRGGDEALRQRLLVAAIRGEKIGTICITEPGAGSDLSAIATRARREGEGFRLTGSKTFITSAPRADFFTVLARSAAGPHEGKLSAFLVERGAPGLGVGRGIKKTGVRGSPTSEVAFDDCPAVLLGGEGEAERTLRDILVEIRTITGALAIGVAQAALDDAVAYAKTRVQFGKPIGQHQAVGLRLAEMATDLEAARHLVLSAAWLADHGRPSGKEAAMAKLGASEAALRICDGAARVLASYGYCTDYPVERYLRDVRFTLIGGGTSEILKLVIARELLAG